MVSKYESMLQVMAKQLVETAIELGGLTAVQGILLMADVENGSGRDVLAWIYGGTFLLRSSIASSSCSKLGVACRLLFEIGLNLNGASLGLDEQDIEVRRKVASASLIMDKYEARGNLCPRFNQPLIMSSKMGNVSARTDFGPLSNFNHRQPDRQCHRWLR